MASDRQTKAEFDAAYPRLLSAAHRAVQNFFRYDPSQVEDTVAETMVRTYERWERVRGHENPTGWVVVCAKNVCLEQLRATARRVRVRGESGQLSASVDDAEETVLSIAIWASLDQLSKRQRDVAVLRYLMDYDELTTATLLGTTVSRVKTAAHEARGRLRALLADLYIDPSHMTP